MAIPGYLRSASGQAISAPGELSHYLFDEMLGCSRPPTEVRNLIRALVATEPPRVSEIAVLLSWQRLTRWSNLELYASDFKRNRNTHHDNRANTVTYSQVR